MIFVLDSEFNRLGVIQNVISVNRAEELNGENVLDFEAVLDEKLNGLIDENSIFELDGSLFDMALLKKIMNEDGTYTAEVESEHISYRLNDPIYNLEYFTEIGTPSYVLERILEGTGFHAGAVEYTEQTTYSAQEAKSRRQLLMEYAAFLGGELIFERTTISIVRHRGSTEVKVAVKGRNVKVVSKTVNKREADEQGNPVVNYTCTPIHLPGETYALGDDVVLVDKTLGIRDTLRVVRVEQNPYESADMTLQFSNVTKGLESDMYRIATSAVMKGQTIFGFRVSPEEGLMINHDDSELEGTVGRTVLNSKTWEILIDGKKIFWADWENKTLVFDGKLNTEVIQSVISISQNVITPYVYADTGAIVNAVVRRLRTDLGKAQLFLDGNTSDVHYQDIGDTDIASGRYFKVDRCRPDLPPVQFTIPSVEGVGEATLWWYEGIEGGSMTTNPDYAIPVDGTEPVPVMVYQYETEVKQIVELRKGTTGDWEVVNQHGQGVNASGRGAGLLDKSTKYWAFIMKPGDGPEIGGIRVSMEDGTELHSKRREGWVNVDDLGGGSGGMEGFISEGDRRAMVSGDREIFVDQNGTKILGQFSIDTNPGDTPASSTMDAKYTSLNFSSRWYKYKCGMYFRSESDNIDYVKIYCQYDTNPECCIRLTGNRIYLEAPGGVYINGTRVDT